MAKDFDGYSLQFLGAARTVTGSKYLLSAGDTRVMVDCGLFQGLKEFRERNWQPLPVEPGSVDHVVLTHAHIDHTGYLPRFARDGFRGPVWTTHATRDLSDFMLRDSAHLQEEEAEFANRKGYSKHKPALPLYSVSDAERVMGLFRSVSFGRTMHLSPEVEVTFHPAGHILGSAIVEVTVRRGGDARTIVFSGDLGRPNNALMKDPESVPAGADALVVESTYGNREHDDKDPRPHITAILKRAVEQKGVVLVPAFAVGRTQEVLLLLKQGMESGAMPRMPVHLDSPMAIDATEIYCKYSEEQRVEHRHTGKGGCAFFFGQLQIAQSVEDSKRLNTMGGPRVIVSASGMATGGRILHHLKYRLGDPSTIVLFVGYQAPGTRGRSLLEGAETVRIHGEEVPVRATVDQIDSLSAHADRSELLDWTATLRKNPGRVYVTHGEPEAAESLAEALRKGRGWNTVVPNHLEKFGLFE